jgi:hypothetical protein
MRMGMMWDGKINHNDHNASLDALTCMDDACGQQLLEVKGVLGARAPLVTAVDGRE